MAEAHDILKKYWGYDQFRPNQEEIISSIHKGNDTLALLPTGGGKSICFQVPALMMKGICIVVTPLIALMQDQVQGLAKKGIKALSIYSGMSRKEIDITLDNAVYGDYAFLYVSPERLQTELFIERFKKMTVCFVAVDEAHCISQWGYDFRPSYLKIADLRTIKPDLRFLALTATATKEVAADIQTQLGFKKPALFQSSFARPNLKYITLKTENKLDDTLSLLSKMNGSGIIYCGTRKQTKILSQHLKNKGLSCTFYHAGLDRDLRKKRQDDWMKNEVKIMISTNAFGMGIDKPDVRFVIHFDVPDSIEAYFQEAGRAGRDLKKARAILFFDHGDLQLLQEKIEWKYPDLATIKNVYTALGNHFQLAIGSGEDSIHNIDLGQFSVKYNLKAYTTYSAIKLLESSGLINLNESNFQQSRLKILVDKITLYEYQVKSKLHNTVIQFILRSHLGIFDEYLTVNEFIIAKKLNINAADVVKTLHFLQKQQVVDYIPKNNGYQIVYLTERLSDQNFSLPKEIYAAKKAASQKNVLAMTDFLTIDECRQSFLLDYFGEKSEEDCGQCSACLGIKFHAPPAQLQYNIESYLNGKLLKEPAIKLETVIAAFPNHNATTITDTIKWLNESSKISIDLSGRVIKTKTQNSDLSS